MHRDSQPLLIFLFATFLLWPTPSQADVLLDITRTGAEIATEPGVIFYGSPKVQKDSLILTSFGEGFLFNWPLLPAASRDSVVIRIEVDFTPLTADSDPTIGLADGFNVIGYLRSDNNSGALFKREGRGSGNTIPGPPVGPLGPTGLGAVDPLTMTYVIENQGGASQFVFEEDDARHTDEFRKFPIDASDAVSLIWGGGNDAGEMYQIHTLSIRITTSASRQGLTYFPLPNCRLANTGQSSEGSMAGAEIRGLRARGENTNFSLQGGTARGCGIPDDAEAIMANVWLFNYDGDGFLRVGAPDKPLGGGSGTLIHYEDIFRNSIANATILDLCDNNLCESDFEIRTQGEGSEIDVAVNVVGYFAPIDGNGAAMEAKAIGQELQRQVDHLESQNRRLSRDLAKIKDQLGIR